MTIKNFLENNFVTQKRFKESCDKNGNLSKVCLDDWPKFFPKLVILVYSTTKSHHMLYEILNMIPQIVNDLEWFYLCKSKKLLKIKGKITKVQTESFVIRPISDVN